MRAWQIIELFLRFLIDFTQLAIKRRIWGSSVQYQNERNAMFSRQAQLYNERAMAMGGLLVKLGQFLSTRVDLLPREYTEELTKLQDAVPAQPFSEIKPIIESELGASLEELFAELNPEPLAAASLGQVYRAVLKTGETVAVKVRRPNIEQLIDQDLTTMRNVVRTLIMFTDVERHIDLMAVYEEFSTTLRRELSYKTEAASSTRIAASLAKLEGIYVPAIYENYSTDRILTMEYVKGCKITDYETLTQWGIDRAMLSHRLFDAYMSQVLEDGFFHADPHPGNVLVRQDGHIILIDFGMVGEISLKTQQEMRKMIVAGANRDALGVVQSLVALKFLRPNADLDLLRRGVNWFVDRFYDLSLEDIIAQDLMAVAEDIESLVRDQPFQIPAQFTFLGRAAGTLFGICSGLDPKLNPVKVIEPYARNFIREQKGDLTDIIIKKVYKTADVFLKLPELAEKTLRKIEQGDIRLRVDDTSRPIGLYINHLLVSRLIYALFTLGLAGAGICAYVSGLVQLGYLLGSSAFVTVVMIVVNSRRTESVLERANNKKPFS